MSVLVFDLPRNKAVEKVRINRRLHSIGARMIQFSTWSLGDTNELIKIAIEIKKAGGHARILEKRFLF